MTIIAWDGKSLAADRQATRGGNMHVSIKSTAWKNKALAWTHDISNGILLAEWYKSGCEPKEFPDIKTDEYASLVVAGHNSCCYYDGAKPPIYMLEPFYAWGSGASFAIGAMAAGASAVEATHITCRHSSSCGMGIDLFYWRRGKIKHEEIKLKYPLPHTA